MAANKDDNNKNVDDDILQCKEDILRAGDVVPPYDNIASIPIETIPDEKKAVLSAGEITEQTDSQNQTERQPVDIPSFDLAEQIMARQRKVTAVKRKSPGKKTEKTETQEKLKLKPIANPDEPRILKLPEKDSVIAEIVARDIEKLRRRGDWKNGD